MSTESLFIKYQNIQKFIVDYRQYELGKEEFYNLDEFTEKIQTLSYIKHTVFNPKTQSDIIILFFKEDSKYIKVSQYFRQFMETLARPYTNKKFEVILIIKHPLVSHIKNTLLPQFNEQFPIYVYYHRVFIIELIKGALCSKHTVLSPEEVNYLCSHDLWVLPTDLPIIYADDPQCIWIGAKAGDVIKIESLSDLTGKTIRYRYVTQLQERFIETEDLNLNEEEEGNDDDTEKLDGDEPSKIDEEDEESIVGEQEKPPKKGGASFIDQVYAGASDCESYSADCTSSDSDDDS